MTWKNLHPHYAGVTAGAARSIVGPVAGTYFTVSGVATTPDLVIDLRELEGSYVRISVENYDVLYTFMDIANVEVAASDMVLTETAEPTARVPDIIWGCTSVREIVPYGFGYLHLRAKTSGESPTVRVRRA